MSASSPSAKSKIVLALGLVDVVRQVTRAWAARERAHEERLGFGAGLRTDVAHMAHDVRDRIPDHFPLQLSWSLPPWRRRPTYRDHLRTWLPVGVVVLAATAGVLATARRIARTDPALVATDPGQVATDSRMVGAVRAGSQAIDAGVSKVVDGGSAAASGTAAVVAAGSTAVRAATVRRAKVELDERVVRPAKHKAIVYGTLGVVGLTVYVVVIAVVVQVLVGAVS